MGKRVRDDIIKMELNTGQYWKNQVRDEKGVTCQPVKIQQFYNEQLSRSCSFRQNYCPCRAIEFEAQSQLHALDTKFQTTSIFAIHTSTLSIWFDQVCFVTDLL